MGSLFDVDHILQTFGLLGVAAIIFAETGLLVGFFLPGDTLLIAGGVFAAEHKLPLVVLLPVAALAAILGYEVGYRIGAAAGPRFFKRKDGLLFKEEYVAKTEELVAQHGAGAILVARFIAVVRTVVPLIAGMGSMNKKSFRLYNIIGAILWTFSVILASFWVGSRIPNIDHYIVYLILLAMILTSGSVLAGLMRSKQKRAELKVALKEEFRYFFKRPK